jgi:hypothetical protein
MVTRADSTGLGIGPVASLGATQRVASVTDTRSQQSFDQFTPASFGKIFKAEVLSSLTDGSFTVKLEEAGTTLQMNLPAGTQVGDKLELTLIGNQPRPTFSLPTQTEPAVSTSISQTGKLIDDLLHTAQSEGAPTTLVGKSALVTSPDAPPTQVATALKNTLAYSGLFYESHVSQWASGERPLSELMREPQAQFSDPKLVAAAARHFAQEASAASDMQLQHAAPETATNAGKPEAEAHTASASSTPVDAKALIAMAHNANPAVEAEVLVSVEHAIQDATAVAVADAALPLPASDTPATTAATATAASTPNAADTQNTPTTVLQEAATDALQVPVANAHVDAAQDMSSQLTTKPVVDATQAIDPSSANVHADMVSNDPTKIVSLQLDTLEHQRIMWQGEVWPGQHMQWEVSEDQSGSHGATADGEHPWQSTLRVDLPSLGIVSATIRLTGQHVQVQMRATSEHTTALLRAHGDKLASAMEAAGSPLDLLTVRQDAAA